MNFFWRLKMEKTKKKNSGCFLRGGKFGFGEGVKSIKTLKPVGGKKNKGKGGANF